MAPKFILQPYCGPVKGFLAMPGAEVVSGSYTVQEKMSCIIRIYICTCCRIIRQVWKEYYV